MGVRRHSKHTAVDHIWKEVVGIVQSRIYRLLEERVRADMGYFRTRGIMGEMNVLEWLEATEEKFPHKLAVNDGKLCLTYRELLEWSKRIGSSISESVVPGRPVMVLMEKSSLTLAVMFGVVYAGCFYVNVHHGQPTERIHKILEVLNPSAVVAGEEKVDLFKTAGYKGGVFTVKSLIHKQIEKERLQKIREKSKETDLLYGMFTSGSTGTPKGIVVSHKSTMQFISHFTDLFAISEKDSIGNQAPFDFDVSVKDIYSAIRTGATLILIPGELFATPPRLLDYLCDNQVTTLIWAVSALCLISALKGLDYRKPDMVKKVMFSGEVMPVKQLQIWKKALPKASFVNLYGPTEITCNCTYYQIRQDFQEGEKIPIGTPFPGRKVFLLDERKQEILMPGKTGEICVAGESLSEGYYRDPKLTGEKFISYPISGTKEQRTYRTGDMGYYGRDGNLYFAGRRDFQIKHMGHRIELEEIEGALSGVEGVASVCCIYDRECHRIVAFYAGDTVPQEIRRNLKKKIPVYMIPNKIVQVERMPMNKNGKIDRNYLMRKTGGS